MGGQFNDHEERTNSPYYCEKKIFLENKENKFISQEKYRALASIFYNDSKIVIFVYEITSKRSLEELNYWIGSVEDKIGSDFVKGIIANKTDLYEDEEVSTDEGEKFAKSKNAKFIEFSAKVESPEKLERFLTELLKEYLQKEYMHSDYYFSNLNKYIILYKWLDK